MQHMPIQLTTQGATAGSGRPLRGSAGDVARSADKVVVNTLKFLHRARAERDYLLSTND